MIRKQTKFRLIVGLSLALAIVVLLFTPRDPLQQYLSRGPNPRPVTVAIGTNKGPVRVFPGFLGCFIIAPDGSLWRWGLPGGYQSSRTNLPEQIDTNHNWLQASAGNGNCVGVTADGRFWSWGQDFAFPLVSSIPLTNWTTTPNSVGIEHQWAWATSGGAHALILKQDGTVWGWGHDSEGQLGNGLGPEETNLVRVFSSRLPHIRTNLVQVGTNADWTAVIAEPSYTLALRADGTLWTWGKIERLLNGQPGGVFPVPTQVCRETNWLALQWDGTGLQGLALDRQGGLWRLFSSPPQPSAAAASVGELFASNCVPGRFALVYPGLCQLHPDGTLWETKADYSHPPNYKLLNDWHRLGKRSDWVALWGGMGAAYGVTVDGTVWTWGSAFGQEGIPVRGSGVRLLENRIRGALGLATKPYSIGRMTPIQREPRPLIKFQGSPSN